MAKRCKTDVGAKGFALEHTREVKGRKDKDGQEGVISRDPLIEALGRLESTKQALLTASADFSAAVKAVAQKTNLNAKAVRALVNARAGEDFDKAKRDVEQQALVFGWFDDLGNPIDEPVSAKANGNGGGKASIPEDPFAGSDLARMPAAPATQGASIQ